VPRSSQSIAPAGVPGNKKLETRAPDSVECIPARACDFCGYDASNTVLGYTQPSRLIERARTAFRRATPPEEKWQVTEFWK
jgi:hypothetical protein